MERPDLYQPKDIEARWQQVWRAQRNSVYR
jgi:hypothetical protein